MRLGLKKTMLGMRNRIPLLSRLLKSESGVGAVEFALLAPVLILLYFSTFELTVALSVNSKISRSTSTVADLVASQTSVTKTFLATMPDVFSSILAPYKTTTYTMKITGVTLDSTAKATVAWSWDQTGGRPYAVGDAVDVPDDLKVADTYLIRSELIVPYSTLVFMPGLAYTRLSSLNMSKTYYFAPRVGTTVPCTNC